jgi:enolase-phosphatase E1
MPSSVVLDIEGTTSATGYVVDRLYPYSAQRFAGWLDAHPDDPDVRRAVAQIRELIGEPAAGTPRLVAALTGWLAADQKVTPLKTLQGLIWAHGFATGDLVAHFYPDVVGALRAWHAAGHRLYVYSSGSVAAQRAWFGHSPAGDLRPLLSGHFDTENAGPKRAPASYRAISTATGTEPADTVFLSDLVTELDAARAAGWHTVGVRRPGEPHYDRGAGDHLEIAAFDQLDLTGDRPLRTQPEPGGRG